MENKMYYVQTETPRECKLPNGSTGATIAVYARKDGDSVWIMVETFQGESVSVIEEANNFADLLETDEGTRNHYLGMAIN